MIVHAPSGKLLFNLNDPGRVTTVIPSARLLEYQGRSIVAVPHREDEVRVLRNLGFDTPAPIEHHYNWPGRFPPFAHQKATAAFLTLNPWSFCLNGMGSGKTLAVLWAFHYLQQQRRATRMLIVAPLSTLVRTWSDEVFTHFTSTTTAVLHGTMDRRLKLLAIPHDIYIINHDGIKSKEMLTALEQRKDIDVVVIDEIASMRNPGTVRFRAAARLVAGRKYVWGLTGTPTPNAPTDAWAQCKLIAPTRVPRYAGAFRDQVMKQQGPFKWVPRDSALEIVKQAMQPAIRFSREECIDLPPTMYQTREVDLTPEQRKAFDSMLKTLKAEYDGGQVLAVNEAVKLGKLIQVALGCMYSTTGERIALPCKPRLDLVREIIEEAEAKVLVFVPLTGALEQLAAELEKRFTVEVVHGETSRVERDRIFGEFQKHKDPHVIVANPGTLSHGLTLTAANTIVWFGPTTSNEIWNQANARIVRPGQKRSTLIVNVESTPLEAKMFDRLRKKTSMQGALLDMLKGE
jgi:SNF2 family DNA or RNA helicase